MALDVDEVLARTDIVNLIGEVVDLRPRNARSVEMVGLCPFHSDTNPSFEVNGAKGIYSCWSCSAGLNNKRGGNALVFVQKYYGFSFLESLTFLAKRAGMPVPEHVFQKTSPKVLQALQASTNAAALIHRATQSASRGQKVQNQAADAPNVRVNKSVLYDVLKTAQDFYRAALLAHPKALEYLTHTRGIKLKVLERYGVGYAPEAFTNINVAYSQEWLGKHPRALINAGLSKVSDKGRQYDFFRDRIMFPVRNAQSKVCGFGARRLSDADVFDAAGKKLKIPKYLNSPATAVFDKSDLLFGLSEARSAIARSGYALLVEGYMDVLGLANEGIDHAVAVMGVTLSEQNVERLRSVTHRVVICMDPDEAGNVAARRLIACLAPYLTSDSSADAQGLYVRIIQLPSVDATTGKKSDPDEYVRRHGKKAFERLVYTSTTLEKFLHNVWTSELTQQSPDKALLAREANRFITTFSDEGLKQSLSKFHESCFGPAASKSGQPSSSATVDGLRTASVPDAQSQAKVSSVHEPSDRLRHSCMMLPEAARIVRQDLIALQKSVIALVELESIHWMARFDQAIAAGLATQKQNAASVVHKLSDLERANHLRVIAAAPSVFSHYLNQISREHLEHQLNVGQIDTAEYLSKVERKRIYQCGP